MFVIRCRSARGGFTYLADRFFPLWVENPAQAKLFSSPREALTFVAGHADWFLDFPDAEVQPLPILRGART